MLKVKKEFEWDKEGSFRNVDPWTMSFVYPRESAPYIIKGGLQNVSSEIKKISEPSLVHEVLFHHGKTRTIHEFVGCGDTSIWMSTDLNSKSKIQRYIMVMKDKKVVFRKKIRRVPRGWIKELNPYF